MTDNKRKKQALAEKLAPELSIMGKPTLLTGTEISEFTRSNNLHLIEASMALGVNTAALYTKKSEDSLNSTLSLLLRLFSAFPDYLPRIQPPDVKVLISKIKEIDPSFKQTHLGPLLGLERNSSTRIKRDGLDNSKPMVQSLAQLIDLLITDNPQNWFLIKAVVEIEAEARSITPASSVWRDAGWSISKESEPATSPKAPEAGSSKANLAGTAKPIVRLAK